MSETARWNRAKRAQPFRHHSHAQEKPPLELALAEASAAIAASDRMPFGSLRRSRAQVITVSRAKWKLLKEPFVDRYERRVIGRGLNPLGDLLGAARTRNQLVERDAAIRQVRGGHTQAAPRPAA